MWGFGIALMEKTELDAKIGRPVNGNLGKYHAPVNADIGNIDIRVVDEVDTHFNPLGAKGIGKIGNTIHHATGERVRDLPITVNKMI